VDLIVPPYLWDQNGEHGHKLKEHMESSAVGRLKFCPLIGLNPGL